MKLKLRVEEFSRAVAIEVVYMDERFRHKGEDDIEFVASNGVKIKSLSNPECSEDIIYLWGLYGEFDTNIMSINFDSEFEQAEWLGNLDEALSDWAKNWEGWKEEEPEIKGNMWSY